MRKGMGGVGVWGEARKDVWKSVLVWGEWGSVLVCGERM